MNSSETPAKEPNGADDALRVAFWFSDVAVRGLPDILSFLESVRSAAAEAEAEEMCNAVSEAIARVEGLAFGFGILRSALTELRLAIPATAGFGDQSAGGAND
jgi:hypothetical protein